MIKILKPLWTIALLVLAVGCTSKSGKVDNVNQKPIFVILDTDMGNDIDDALALDMIYKYADRNVINLLGIMINKDYIHAPEFIDIMATWYGYADIPVGIMKVGDSLNINDKNYTKTVADLKSDGKYIFERTLSDYNSLPSACKLYRKILAEQPDNSVVVISIGFLTNLASLIESPPDEYSALNGKKLVEKKVKLLSIMAGSFTGKSYVEYNVMMDKPAATKVFAEWPCEIIASPFELGDSIRYPGKHIETDFMWTDKHPLVEAYKAYGLVVESGKASAPKLYDRCTWDLTSVLYVCEPDSMFFSKSPGGIITSDKEGYTHFIEDIKGKHRYLITTDQQKEAIKEYFVKIIAEKPKKYK